MRIEITKKYKTPDKGRIWEKGKIMIVGNAYGRLLIKKGVAKRLPDIERAVKKTEIPTIEKLLNNE